MSYSSDSNNGLWFLWVIFIAVFLLLMVWRCIRRQQIMARYQAANSPGVQMIALQSQGITAPPGFTPVLVNGQIVFQPLYAAGAAYPPPDYQQYPPGVAAQPVPYASQPGQGGMAVAAIPVQFYEQGRGFRLNDQPAAISSSASQLPMSPSAAYVPQPSPSAQERYDGEAESSPSPHDDEQPLPTRYSS